MSLFGSLFQILFGRRSARPSTPPASPASAPTPTPMRPAPSPPSMMSSPPAGAPAAAAPSASYLSSLHALNAAPLARADFEVAAGRLNCDWEALAAVAEVESGRLGAFASDGRPVISFHRHLFSRKTNSRFDASNPNVSNRTPGAYQGSQEECWRQLTEAFALDPEAALQSTSFGRFQLLGQHYAQLGLSDAHQYVTRLARSERDQLEAFEAFIRASGLADELQRGDWTGFASRYNGPGYAVGQIDDKIAQAYARLKSQPIA